MTFWLLFILTVFLCLGEFSFGGQRNRSLMQSLGISIIVWVAVLRFDVGYDYMSYYQGILSKDLDFEILSRQIFLIGVKSGYPPLTFMIIGILIYCFVFSTLRQFSANFFVAVMVYVCIFYLPSLNTIRQSLAVAIVFWGVRYIYRQAPLRYILICILASQIHSSAIATLLFYPLYRFVSAKYMPVLIVAIVLGYHIMLELFASVNFYAGLCDALQELSEEQKINGGGSYSRYAMVIVVISMYFLSWLKKANVDYRLLSISAMGCVFPFILGSHMGSRISEYFLIHLCLVVPQVLNAYKIRFRMLITAVFMCYFLLLIVVGRGQSRASFFPYQTIFNIQNVKSPIFRQP